jgi:hypothetical protein
MDNENRYGKKLTADAYVNVLPLAFLPALLLAIPRLAPAYRIPAFGMSIGVYGMFSYYKFFRGDG